MEAQAQRSWLRVATFFVIAVCVYAIATAALLSIPQSQRELVAGIAIPLDLMVFLPTVFYFLVIKRFGLAPVLLLPVIALGGIYVFQIVRPENMTAVLIIGALALTAEVTIAVREIRRIGKLFQSAKRSSNDPFRWFYAPVYEVVRNRRATNMLVAELTTIYYGFFSWRKKPFAPHGATAFSYHKETGYTALVGVIMFLMPLEMIVLHIFLSQWSVAAAWVLTVTSLYSAIWLWGDCRASVLRPILISEDSLIINSGVRFFAEIPLSLIEETGASNPDLPKKAVMNMGIMGSSVTWIVFTRDVEVSTFFGARKMIRAIGLSVDNASSFKKMLSDATSG